jgi:protein-disulfide isomerase
MNKVFIPVSIIVAGLIIAGAVVLTNNAENVNPDVVENERPELELNPITNDDHIRGNPDAEVLIVEYSDFECPFCGAFHGTMKRIMDEYGDSGQVAWVYRHMPLDRIHDRARPAAEASECVADLAGPERFWDFADEVFVDESKLSDEGMKEIALSYGIDEAAYDSCVSERKFQERVERDYQDGLNIAKVDPNFGTPYNILMSKNGVQIPIVGNQPYASVKNMIDAVLVGDTGDQMNEEAAAE